MWVFGYGSLMWDSWEQQFQGIKHIRATLNGYQRNFNKKSTRNWGTNQTPCPTLGLEQIVGETCVGCAFEFDDNSEMLIMDYLRDREGNSFTLARLNVELENGQIVQAVTPINQRNHTYIGNLTIEDRVQSARIASGTDGNCCDYIDNIHRHLEELGIGDTAVNAMWEALQ